MPSLPGLEQMIEYIENLKFTDEDIEYLRSLNIFEEDFLEYLSNFRFTGDIYAIPEGTVVFPREPLVKVVAPIMEAQLVEDSNPEYHQSPEPHCYQSSPRLLCCKRVMRSWNLVCVVPRDRMQVSWRTCRSHRWMCRYFLCSHRQNVRRTGPWNSRTQLDHELPG